MPLTVHPLVENHLGRIERARLIETRLLAMNVPPDVGERLAQNKATLLKPVLDEALSWPVEALVDLVRIIPDIDLKMILYRHLIVHNNVRLDIGVC